VTIESDTSAFEIAIKMLELNVSAVVIMDSGRHVGIVTERDLTRQVVAKDSLPSKTPATAIMSAPLVTISKDSTIETAAATMIRKAVRHLAVQDGDIIVGMITGTDLFKYVKDSTLARRVISPSVLEVLYSAEESTEENL
jgi:signal-transduction protein with cAMP-binding, CBS, and nucleotidyltransferase domain